VRLRGTDVEELDADEADVAVEIPGKLTAESGNVKLAVRAGSVSERLATGLAAASKLPALRARVRGTPTPTAPSTAASPIKLKVNVPALQSGEKFELRLGGGGNIDR
jgi:hypothetical protein